MPIKAVCPAN